MTESDEALTSLHLPLPTTLRLQADHHHDAHQLLGPAGLFVDYSAQQHQVKTTKRTHKPPVRLPLPPLHAPCLTAEALLGLLIDSMCAKQ